MTPEVLAEWLRRQKLTIVRTTSSFWVEAGPRIYQAFPYHLQIDPSADELTQLFFRHGAMGARFSSPWETNLGAVSYHVVFSESSCSLHDLPKKARHDVKKGLETFDVEAITFDRLAVEGWEVREETLARQGRLQAETQDWWRRLCASTEGLPGLEAWGALRQGRLAAALIAITCDGYCCILYHQSRTEYLPMGVNNALTFVFTNDVLRRQGDLKLFYGLHSLDAPSSVDAFKFRMGYRALPVFQRVVFHPWVRPLLNSVTYRALQVVQHRRPDVPALAKASGLLRVYLDSRRPVPDQEWPECLQDQRRDLLGIENA